MLAFILLVVLGGGLGLLAVSLAESPKPATDRGNERRAPDPDDESPDPADAADGPPEEASLEAGDDPPRAVPDEAVEEPDPSFETELVEAFAAGSAVDPAPSREAPAPRRRPDPRHVPSAYTAVEGRFDEVAVPPIWRRLLSICAIVVFAVVLGVGVAAIAAAVIGTLAELLNAAVG